jgi:hypothetical protein
MIFTPQVMNCFCELVGKRLEKADKSRPLTEDEVQDSLNYSLVSRGIVEEHEIRMEYGFPGLAGKLDSYVDSSAKHGPVAWEVKYDRKAPGGKAAAKFSKAALSLRDIFRLASLPESGQIERLFFYLTDAEMLEFLENQLRFFSLAEGETFDVSPTLIAGLDERLLNLGRGKTIEPVPCSLRVLYSRTIRDHHLRLYEVCPELPARALA